MAGGLVAFGDDRVTATSTLGVPVADVAIEPGWTGPTVRARPSVSGGDRLYVATGTDVRVYDLQTRALLATFVLPGAHAVAIDATDHRLFVGTASGDILTLDTAVSAGDLRAGTAAGTGALPSSRSVPLAIGGRRRRPALGDRRRGDPHRGDARRRARVARRDQRDAARLVQPARPRRGRGRRHRRRAGRRARARDRPDVRGGRARPDPRRDGRRVRAAAPLRARPRVTITTAITAQRTQLDSAIASGALAGISVTSVPRIAVADAAGVTFVEPASGAVTGAIPLDGGATSVVGADGLDSPMLYAATGSSLAAIVIPADGTAPSLDQTVWMPAAISRVTVRLGEPDGPRAGSHDRTGPAGRSTSWSRAGTACFADARLPFAPTAWATDVQPGLPRHRPRAAARVRRGRARRPRSTSDSTPSRGASRG